MISRNHRFHGYRTLRHVYQKGNVARSSEIALKYMLNQRRSSYRLAVVISRKVEKSAVRRNRMRRRLYETVRLLENDISGPYDIVLTVFSNSILTHSPDTLSSLVQNQFKSAGILAKTPKSKK